MQTNPLSTRRLLSSLWGKRILLGALLTLIAMAIFLSYVKYPDPAWPKAWQLKPLITVTLAGALGGAFYHFLDYLRHPLKMHKTLAIFIGSAGYLVAFWLGSVLGLAGTLWD